MATNKSAKMAESNGFSQDEAQDYRPGCQGIALDKVQKKLGVRKASLGSLSEAVRIFDPGPLKELAKELGD